MNVLPSITASATSSSICVGASSTLSGTGGISYSWMPGSLSGSPVVTPVTTTTYTLTGTDVNGCTASNIMLLQVNALPTITQSPFDQTVTAGSTATFVVICADPQATYQWQRNIGAGFQNLSNGVGISGVTNDSLLVSGVNLSDNGHLLRCVLSLMGCSDTSGQALLTVDVANSIGSLNQLSGIEVYPNPVQNSLMINWSMVVAEAPKWQLFDMSGRRFAQGVLQGKITCVDMSALAQGIYTLQILSNGQNQLYKLIKGDGE